VRYQRLRKSHSDRRRSKRIDRAVMSEKCVDLKPS
jgi:hypothetical protein